MSCRIQPRPTLALLCLKCRRLGSSWSCSIAGGTPPSLSPCRKRSRRNWRLSSPPLSPLVRPFYNVSPSPNLVKLFSAAFTITKHKEEEKRGGRAERMKPELRRARNLCWGRSTLSGSRIEVVLSEYVHEGKVILPIVIISCRCSVRAPGPAKG